MFTDITEIMEIVATIKIYFKFSSWFKLASLNRNNNHYSCSHVCLSARCYHLAYVCGKIIQKLVHRCLLARVELCWQEKEAAADGDDKSTILVITLPQCRMTFLSLSAFTVMWFSTLAAAQFVGTDSKMNWTEQYWKTSNKVLIHFSQLA